MTYVAPSHTAERTVKLPVMLPKVSVFIFNMAGHMVRTPTLPLRRVYVFVLRCEYFTSLMTNCDFDFASYDTGHCFSKSPAVFLSHVCTLTTVEDPVRANSDTCCLPSHLLSQSLTMWLRGQHNPSAPVSIIPAKSVKCLLSNKTNSDDK